MPLNTIEYTQDDLKFLRIDNIYRLIWCNPECEGEVVIPPIINNLKVTEIGDKAFSGCFKIVSIIIPNGIISVGDNAFSRCYKLMTINIPDTVIKMGNYVFISCKDLSTIIIPKSIKTIGDGAFQGCSRLVSITIPDSVISIGKNAFERCSSLTSISIPDSIISIGNYAFMNCKNLVSITLSERINSIGSYVFWDCSSLGSIIIPHNVTSIDKSAFSGCSSLTTIDLHNYIGNIGEHIFLGVNHLTSFIVPQSVALIYNKINTKRNKATTFTIPDKITSIGENTFQRCNSLTSITIPNSVTSIGDSVFSNCKNLVSITLSDRITSIGSYVFYDCSSLASITIPNSVTSIDKSAFSGCSSLISIIIPDSATSIDESAFSGCSSLISIIIPDSVTSIDKSAFSGCSSLASITIPESVTSIADDVIKGCTSLDSIELYNYIGNIGDRIFLGKRHLISFIVNRNVSLICNGIKMRRKTTTTIIIPESILDIGEFAFSGCANLDAIIIPESVIGIGDSAFLGCSSLTSIIIPNSVKSLGGHIFERCSNLTSVTIPDSEISIGEYAFSDCCNLTSIFLPKTITNIEPSVFSGCSSLISIIIPDSVISIGVAAFMGCSSLTSIILPKTITNIEPSVFSGCSSLISIIIPKNVTNIGEKAFLDCNNLNSITISGDLVSIAPHAFDVSAQYFQNRVITKGDKIMGKHKKNSRLLNVVLWGGEDTGKPSNYGKKWTQEHIEELRIDFIAGMDVDQIALKLGRDLVGVIDRLDMLELINNETRQEIWMEYQALYKDAVLKYEKKTKATYPLFEDAVFLQLLGERGCKLAHQLTNLEMVELAKIGLIIDSNLNIISNIQGEVMISGLKGIKPLHAGSLLIVEQPVLFGNERVRNSGKHFKAILDNEFFVIGTNPFNEIISVIDEPIELSKSVECLLIEPLCLIKKPNGNWWIDNGQLANEGFDLTEKFLSKINRFLKYEKEINWDFKAPVVPRYKDFTYILIDNENNLFGIGDLKGVFYAISKKRYHYSNTPVLIETYCLEAVHQVIRSHGFNYVLDNNKTLFMFGKESLLGVMDSDGLEGSDSELIVDINLKQLVTMDGVPEYRIDIKNGLSGVDYSSSYYYDTHKEPKFKVLENVITGVSGRLSMLFIDLSGNLYEMVLVRKFKTMDGYKFKNKTPELIRKNVKDAAIFKELNFILEKNGNLLESTIGDISTTRIIMNEVEELIKSTNHILAVKNDRSVWIIR